MSHTAEKDNYEEHGKEGAVNIENKNVSDSISSDEEVEELSSFEISDNGGHSEDQKASDLDSSISDKNGNTIDESRKEKTEPFSHFGSNSEIPMMSTPKKSRIHHHISHRDNPPADIPQSIKTTDSAKRSATLSSDTFETPKTVDTRTSTMTSNTHLDYNNMNNDLNFSGAAVIRGKQSNDVGKRKFLNKSPQKRLSRQNNYDTSFDIKSDFNQSPIEKFFAKLNIEEDETQEENVNNIAAATKETFDLQNQLTNCKVQIKLLNDLLRDKLFNSLTNGVNRDEMSENFEKHVLDTIDYRFHTSNLNELPTDYAAITRENQSLKEKNEDLQQNLEMLREQFLEHAHNQFDWQNRINKVISKLNYNQQVEPSNKINNFEDILMSLDDHINKLISTQTKPAAADSMDHLNNQDTQVPNNLSEHTSRQPDILETSDSVLLERLNKYKEQLEHSECERKKLLQFQKKLHLQVERLLMNESNLKQQESEHKRLLSDIERKYSKLSHQNLELLENNRNEKAALNEIIICLKNYHIVFIDLLKKVIDPTSTGKIQSALDALVGQKDYKQVLKILTVTQNFEIESISTILKNYEAIVKEKSNLISNNSVILDLKSQNNILNRKLLELEKARATETSRVKELESQNSILKDRMSEKSDIVSQLKQLRLNDLNTKWKTAEVALSQTKKGAMMKIHELEQEIEALKSHLKE
ncbi:hypothetical protein JL09_g2746 [Pichia kudriavzevii]|uniref:Uncharacterized protein n=1 Tax=Pichia kudriavzevii TaxID=4909 RepID=A0A099NZP1_PICKU|nr:hypothetical protein JL09_g2746 [Pichia kudriavzevii]